MTNQLPQTSTILYGFEGQSQELGLFAFRSSLTGGLEPSGLAAFFMGGPRAGLQLPSGPMILSGKSEAFPSRSSFSHFLFSLFWGPLCFVPGRKYVCFLPGS